MHTLLTHAWGGSSVEELISTRDTYAVRRAKSTCRWARRLSRVGRTHVTHATMIHIGARSATPLVLMSNVDAMQCMCDHSRGNVLFVCKACSINKRSGLERSYTSHALNTSFKVSRVSRLATLLWESVKPKWIRAERRVSASVSDVGNKVAKASSCKNRLNFGPSS